MISCLIIWLSALLLALWLTLWCSFSAGAAISAVLILTAAVSAAVNRMSSLKLSSEAAIAKCCEKSESISGTVAIKNAGKHSHRTMRAFLTAENLLTGEKTRIKISVPFFKGQRTQTEVSFAAEQCGCIRISLEKIRLYDISGLSWKSFPDVKLAEVTVMPEIIALEADISDVFKSSTGEDISIKAGSDISEPFEMSEYKAGDSIKAINFKLSQKHGKLIVKRGSDVNESAVRIALFCGSCSDAKRLCYAAELAVSLSSTLCEMGICHDIITDDIYTVNYLEDLSAVMPKLLSGTQPLFPHDGKPVICICADEAPENVEYLIPVYSADDICAGISERGGQYA